MTETASVEDSPKRPHEMTFGKNNQIPSLEKKLPTLEWLKDYKKIIKELLFNGANRSLRTDSGHTPRDLLDDIEDSLEVRDY